MKCKNCKTTAPAFVEICPKCGLNPRTAQKVMEIIKDDSIKETSLLKRFINLFLDTIFYIIFVIIFSFILSIFIILLENAGLMPESLYKDYEKIIDAILGNIFGLSLFFLYYVFLEFKFEKTIGKFITGTKVVLINGEKPDVLTLVIRTLCRLIPFDAFSYIFAKESGWHDRFSKTMVVDKNYKSNKKIY
jgi:uncharacterized RDD family membrane protein YckC